MRVGRAWPSPSSRARQPLASVQQSCSRRRGVRTARGPGRLGPVGGNHAVAACPEGLPAGGHECGRQETEVPASVGQGPGRRKWGPADEGKEAGRTEGQHLAPTPSRGLLLTARGEGLLFPGGSESSSEMAGTGKEQTAGGCLQSCHPPRRHQVSGLNQTSPHPPPPGTLFQPCPATACHRSRPTPEPATRCPTRHSLGCGGRGRARRGVQPPDVGPTDVRGCRCARHPQLLLHRDYWYGQGAGPGLQGGPIGGGPPDKEDSGWSSPGQETPEDTGSEPNGLSKHQQPDRKHQGSQAGRPGSWDSRHSCPFSGSWFLSQSPTPVTRQAW